ncbi:hypothetical protein G7Z17_g10278 [Cylindrodendrum hubeiense]|uniref:Uncharacterized protein n=1 Tax=Cylindrodendrum hubeiense TaxID=595255 RepID=A0A9P5GXZ4_9HYPO|nr:hypothetical protein G7Z17_g10278 [Cylindrodendrum hubeiense]
MKSVILLNTLWSALGAAQQYTYTTATVTECFSTTPTSFGQPAPTQGPDNYWTVMMPECQYCECDGCTYTHEYTATFDVFYPKGTAPWPYSVREIYPGMSTLPIMATPTTKVPYGFTAAVKTCRVCGNEPIAATLTYPRGSLPYRQNVPVPRDVDATTTPAATTPSASKTWFAPVPESVAPSETSLANEKREVDDADSKGEVARSGETSNEYCSESTCGVDGNSESTVPSKISSRINRRSYDFMDTRSYQDGSRTSDGEGSDTEEADEVDPDENTRTQSDAAKPTQRMAPIARDESTSVEGAADKRFTTGGWALLILPLLMV